MGGIAGSTYSGGSWGAGRSGLLRGGEERRVNKGIGIGERGKQADESDGEQGKRERWGGGEGPGGGGGEGGAEWGWTWAKEAK